MTPDQLLRAAEDHFLHAQLLSAWIVDYIDLEESLAVGSIVQEELAHGATLLEVAGHDRIDRDVLIYERPLDDWYPTRLLGIELPGWPAAILRALLLSCAAVVRSDLWAVQAEPPLRAASAVLVSEQRLHVAHWSRWTELLGNDPSTRGELLAAAESLLPLGGDLFGERPGAAGAPDRRALHATWLELVQPGLASARVEAELLPRQSVARQSAREQPGAVAALNRARALRVDAEGGVRGVYL
jgi:1,2-phenylacetyl-CoA epoxidase catalytic subunit